MSTTIKIITDLSCTRKRFHALDANGRLWYYETMAEALDAATARADVDDKIIIVAHNKYYEVTLITQTERSFSDGQDESAPPRLQGDRDDWRQLDFQQLEGGRIRATARYPD